MSTARTPTLRSLLGAVATALLLQACGGGGGATDAENSVGKEIALGGSADVASVVALSKVSETRVSRTVYEYVFRVTVRNGVAPQAGLEISLLQAGANTTIIDGSVEVGPVVAEALVTPESDTITLRHDRRYPFDAATLLWSVLPKADLATASATLGPVGGNVSLTAADGTRFDLGVPAGALTQATAVRLATRAAPAGGRFQLVLQPAGLVLRIPATLVIRLPAGVSLPATGGLVLAGRPVPFERRADGALLFQVGHFARPGGASAAASGRVQARERRLAAVAQPCAGPPGFEASLDSGGLTDQDLIDTEIYAQCMKAAVQDAAADLNLGFDKAVRMALTTAAYLQRVGGLGEADPFIAEAARLACTAFAFELDAVRGTEVTSVKSVYRVTQPLLFWARTEQQLGASCAGTEDWQAVVQQKVSDALAWYQGESVDLNELAGPTYARAMNEARDGVEAIAEVQAVRPEGTVANVLSSQIETRALGKRVEGLIAAPWQRCRADGRYDALTSLAGTVGVIPAIQRAAQYCGSSVGLQSRFVSGAVEHELDGRLGGQAAAREIVAETLSASPDGSLRLAGSIGQLGCPHDSTGGSEALVLKVAGTEVRRVAAAPYLQEPLILDIADAMRRANLDPRTTEEAALTVERDGEPCQGFWGAAPRPLLEVKLNLMGCKPPQGQSVCVTPVTAGWFEDGMINAEGKVLFFRNGRGWIWAHGQLTALPPEFSFAPWLLDSGTVVGQATTTTSLGIPGFLPAAFDAAGFRYTADPQTFGTSSDRSQSVTVLHGAYQNRVWALRDQRTLSPTDLGGCQLLSDQGIVSWLCRRIILMASADGSGSLQPLRTLSHWPAQAFFDRFDGPLSMNAQDSLVGGGVTGAGQENYVFGGLLSTSAGLTMVAPGQLSIFIDDAGVIYSTSGPRISVASPVVASPVPAYPAPGSSIGAMNAGGDVVSCDSATNPTEMVLSNTATGRVLARLTAMPGSGGVAVPLVQMCRRLISYTTSTGIGPRKWPGLDRHARLLTTGIDDTGRSVRVVVTPRGKPLPPTTAPQPVGGP